MSEPESRLLTLIVTCQKSPAARVASARAALAALDLLLDVELVNGVIDEDSYVDALYDAHRNRRWMKRPLSRTEIAVYASHRLAWERLVASGQPAALVLEDDFAIRDHATFVDVIRNRDEIFGERRNILKLFDFRKRVEKLPYFETRAGSVPLVKWASPTAGMVAYLITRDGATKFLSRQRVFRQIDEDIKYFWELGLDVWSVPGNPVTEISDTLGGSLVEPERRRVRQQRLLRSLWWNLITVHRKARTRWHLSRERRGQERPRAYGRTGS